MSAMKEKSTKGMVSKKEKVVKIFKKKSQKEGSAENSAVKSLQKPLKRKKIPSDGDDTWERAVKKARGSPDGKSRLSDKSNLSIKSKSNKSEDTGPLKDKKKKPALKAFKSAAGKLKKFTDKGKGLKKKLDSKEKKTQNGKSDKQSLKRKTAEDGPEHLTVKERKRQRKMHKNNYETSQRAKTIWEQLRRTDLPADKKASLSAELFKIIQGKAKEMIFAHDTSRVVQCLMKYGNAEQRSALFEELREDILEISKSKYARFFVKKLMKYGTKAQRDYVFRSFYGNVRKLVRHKEAAEILEFAYNDYANASQRAIIIEEFYGPTYALYKTAELRTLEQVVASSSDKRDKILSYMKEALSVLVDKTICQFSIVHKAFNDYFSHATDKHKSDMIEVVRESIIHMLHTSDGARVAMQCLWHGTAKSKQRGRGWTLSQVFQKPSLPCSDLSRTATIMYEQDRKVIIKSMKSYVIKICKENHGHLVLLALFDVVDDTKLVQKVILDEILKNLHEVAQDQFGKKVLLYLLHKRDPLHFNSEIVTLLQTGDSNPHSKKDAAVRRDELCQHMSQPLLEYIIEHSRELVTSNSSLLLILSILTHAKGNPSSAMKAVCEIAAEPFTNNNPGNYHIVEHPAGHLTLKKLIQNDHNRIKESQQVFFTNVLLETLPAGALKSWAACNRGCFILITMLELGVDSITKRVRSELSPIKKSLGKLSFKGAQVLLEKL